MPTQFDSQCNPSLRHFACAHTQVETQLYFNINFNMWDLNRESCSTVTWVARLSRQCSSEVRDRTSHLAASRSNTACRSIVYDLSMMPKDAACYAANDKTSSFQERENAAVATWHILLYGHSAWSVTSPCKRLCSSPAAAFRFRWQRCTRSTYDRCLPMSCCACNLLPTWKSKCKCFSCQFITSLTDPAVLFAVLHKKKKWI